MKNFVRKAFVELNRYYSYYLSWGYYYYSAGYKSYKNFIQNLLMRRSIYSSSTCLIY